MSDPRLYLSAAFDALLSKAYAPRNLAKQTWVGHPTQEITRWLLAEDGELHEAIDDADDVAILLEAADVLAFAAMNSTRQGEPYIRRF